MATQNKELARQLLLSRPQLPKALFQVCTFVLYLFLCEFIQAQHSLMTNLSLSSIFMCLYDIDVHYSSYQVLYEDNALISPNVTARTFTRQKIKAFGSSG